ncbi:hypothetical protein JOT59_001447 [Campylobacter coli]|nr:hypothetical protein [Campylobacter coli]EBF5565956.1 hypothetical protein [Campylobacter coli]EDO6888215.1 hypothetical protein [Campylobacter coli]EFT5758966.1 hypothetical protein [Campylobacter coli]EHA5055888.1 hypothetical protein [Campylobacter coli]
MRAIYIDNKVKGAIQQLINYFIEGVFDRSNTKVIFKYHKETFLFYLQELRKYKISYEYYFNIRSINVKDYEVVFYLFNAQSNCSIVACRDTKHIFVTHGESNKLASIKPIIRIYDYIICAGDMGVSRYLQNKIFNTQDIQTNRVIKMGDTFIGKSPFKKANDNKNAYILYAPTWEGGIESEQYSSLSEDLHAFKIIQKYARESGIKKIIIQPHPNTGHRDKKYKKYLNQGIKFLKSHNLEVENIGIYNNKSNLLTKIFSSRKSGRSTYPVYQAFVDVSAMEIQLLNEYIPIFIFINKTKNAIVNKQILKDYYDKITIQSDVIQTESVKELEQIKDFYIGYSFDELKSMTKNKRVDWLVDFVSKENYGNKI